MCVSCHDPVITGLGGSRGLRVLQDLGVPQKGLRPPSHPPSWRRGPATVGSVAGRPGDEAVICQGAWERPGRLW